MSTATTHPSIESLADSLSAYFSQQLVDSIRHRLNTAFVARGTLSNEDLDQSVKDAIKELANSEIEKSRNGILVGLVVAAILGYVALEYIYGGPVWDEIADYMNKN